MSRRRFRLALPLVALLWGISAGAIAAGLSGASADPPPAPPGKAFPRIEAGQHTAPIVRIGVDSAGRWLVTASHDKTARVWDLKTGALLRVLRPPIGEGDEGKLYAAALSPDGGTVAVGGWTSPDGRNTSIYLFDRETGELKSRIGGLPNRVTHLAFCPDGTRLAAALRASGIRVYRSDTWAEIGRDEDYRSQSFWVAFDRAGRLASTELSGPDGPGAIRLYDKDLKQIAKETAPGGRNPFGLAFSPDGTRIALGFNDSTAVSVLSGADLSPLYAADTSGIDNGDLSKIAWSSDGRTLFAAGRYNMGGVDALLVSWPDSGRGPAVRRPIAKNTVMDLVPLADGRLVFGSADPAWGLLDANADRVLGRGPSVADFRTLSYELRLSEDGRVAELDLQVLDAAGVWREHVLRIDLADRRPTLDPGSDLEQVQRRLSELGYPPGWLSRLMNWVPSSALRGLQDARGLPLSGDLDAETRNALSLPLLSGPRTESSGLSIDGWLSSQEPKRNGKPLDLEPFETSWSADIAADSSRFLLGTAWLLRLYDRDGKALWQIPIPSTAWKVKLSADGRWAVAAFGDGTLRWFDTASGQERLALFIDGSAIAALDAGQHSDKPDRAAEAAPKDGAPAAAGFPWVLWTPEGFFDSGGGGERLMGWHINRGADRAAELIDAAQIGEVFRRPDLIAKALDPDYPDLARTALAGIGDLDGLLAGTRAPALERLGPAEVRQSGRSFAARFAVQDRGGGVGRIEYRIDGVLIGQGDLRGHFGLGLPGRTEETRPFTLDPGRYRIEARVFERSGRIASPPVTWQVEIAGDTREPPALYGLAVGIGPYRDASLSLEYGDDDAEAFTTALNGAGQGLFRTVEIESLVNEQATLDGIVTAFESLAKKTKPEDVFVLFLAGHGLVQDGRWHFIPWDLRYTNRQALADGSLGEDRLRDLLAQVRALKSLVVLDACHAGAALGAPLRLAGLVAGPGAPGVRGGEALETRAAIDRLMAKTGRAILASTTGRDFALEGLDGHGVFTFALLEGLSGRADLLANRDGTVETGELADYLESEVPRISRQVWRYEQYPMRELHGQSFPIGLRRVK